MKKILVYALSILFLTIHFSILSNNSLFLSAEQGEKSETFFLEYSKAASSSTQPTGFLDEVSSNIIGGWAWNSSIPDTPINIHIYIRDSNGISIEAFQMLADEYRADLAELGYGNGYHGFTYEVNWVTYPPGEYTVTVYLIGGNNPMASGSPKTYTVSIAEGNVDTLDSSRITGWAWKPDAPNESIDTHVYIRRTNGTSVVANVLKANIYRSDLENAGYGDGYHGFTMLIDWDSLPEENLLVQVYAVDNSGVYPLIFQGYYDNRKPINLIGMTDAEGFDFSVWINSTVRGYCEDIGCSEFNKYVGANYLGVIQLMADSSYCVISTHGSSTGIDCNYQGNFSYLTTTNLNTLTEDYFNTTRCVLLDACSTASGGANNQNNFVNTLYSRGVQSVVGFQEETYFFFDENNNVVSDKGNKLWATVFTRCLSEAKTIDEAIQEATNAVYLEHNQFYGLDSHYVAGDRYQVVKH